MEEIIKTYEDGINFINQKFPPLSPEEEKLTEDGNTPTEVAIPLLRRGLVNQKLTIEFDNCINKGLPTLEAFYEAFHTSRLFIEKIEEELNK